ncbi:hypothetical protein BsWGS_23524 [Bradybaena similaris]
MTAEPEQGAMIDITVKTLDGQNRTFSVQESLNVHQFKEKISSTIEIPADSQRLIFQGRVMQDDKILKDYNVHGKVIHLVQRAPPSTVSNSTTSSPTVTTSTTPTARPQIQLIHLGRLQSTPNTREARARIRQADFNLRLINDVLSQFEHLGPRSEEHNGNALGTESGLGRPVTDSEDSMDTSAPEAGRRGQSDGREQPQQPWQTRSESAEAASSDQQTGLMAAELADFLEQLLNTNSRMVAHVRHYQSLLRSEENYTANSREAQNAQDVVNRVNEVFHALGHMLHSLSDVTVDMNASVPRQAIALPPVPFQIPGTASMAIPIHMNVRSRSDVNRNRQRTSQSNSNLAPATESRPTAASTGAATTPENSAATVSTTASSTGTAGISNIQIPSLSLPLPQNSLPSGDSAVMVEVYPTSVTVHDIRAVVTQAEMDVDPDASTESAAVLGSNRADITVTSSTTVEHPLVTPAASATTAATLTTASTQPSAPSIQSSGTSSFTTTSTSSSTFTFGPATSVSFGGVTNLASGQIPNVPGLPPGMLQNILGSILSSHGMQHGQPVQVNVVQQVATTAESPSVPVQIPFFDLPLDNDRSRPQNQRQPFNQNSSPSAPVSTTQNASSGGRNAETFVHVATNTAPRGAAGSVNASTNTNLSTNAATNTSSSAGINTFTSTVHLPHTASQSFTSSGTRTDPSMGTSSRATNTPRPFLFHPGPQGATRPQPAHTRLNQPSSLRSMPGSHGYVDPYLPCASPQYMSQTALAALSALQEQTRSQQPQQQVPNLSNLVSGMVGEIIGQVGQATQQSLSNSARTSSTAAAAATNSHNSSYVPGAGTGAAAGISGQPPPTMNELFSQILGAAGGTGQTGPFPPEVAPMINSIFQAASAAATSTNANNRGGAAPPSWTLADLFSQVRSASEDRAGELSVIISLLEAVAPHIGIPDLFSLVMGGGHVLNRVRRPLQESVRSLVSRHGSLEQLVEVALRDMHLDIQYLQGLVQVKDGIDMTQSLCNCLRAHLMTIFSAICLDSAGAQNFGDHLYALWVKMLAESIALCVYCIHDGHAGFLSMLQNYVPRMTQGMSPVFTSWMTVALQSILGSFYGNHPVAESDIRGYIVRLSAPTTVSSDVQNHTSSQLRQTTTDANQSSTSGTSPTVPIDTTKSPTLQSPKAKVPRTTLREDGAVEKPCDSLQPAAVNQLPPATPPSTLTTQVQQPPATPPSTLATQVQHTEPAEGGSRMEHRGAVDDWHSVVPQEWIPVITGDIVKQQEHRPQPPFSDAYLQGFPAKRRRMMTLEHCHEMGNMLHYLPDSLKRAARTAGVEPCTHEDTVVQEAANNLDLQAELEREVTSALESRISSDQDYSSDRFPNAEEYFRKSKHHQL